MHISTDIHSEKHGLSSIKQLLDLCFLSMIFYNFFKYLEEANFHSKLSVTQSTQLIQCGSQDVEAVLLSCD